MTVYGLVWAFGGRFWEFFRIISYIRASGRVRGLGVVEVEYNIGWDS